jgi:hypothetical protein
VHIPVARLILLISEVKNLNAKYTKDGKRVLLPGFSFVNVVSFVFEKNYLDNNFASKRI